MGFLHSGPAVDELLQRKLDEALDVLCARQPRYSRPTLQVMLINRLSVAELVEPLYPSGSDHCVYALVEGVRDCSIHDMLDAAQIAMAVEDEEL